MKYLIAILVGGIAAGALDILSAFATYVPHGATVGGILRFVASGLLGSAALKGHALEAAAGLAVHFSLTTAMAAVYVGAATRLPVLLQRPWLFGVVYGVLAYLAMTYVIVPHSAVASWKPATGWAIVGGLLAHCMYVGVPIAHAARRFLAGPAASA